MSVSVAELEAWCQGSGIAVEVDGGRLRFRLDPASSAWVGADLPAPGAPLRLEGRVRTDTDDLDPARRAEVVEDVVLSRSGLVDARPAADGTAAEIIVVLYPEGLNRHTFLEGLFEVQKVGLLLQRELAAAAAAEAAVAALTHLADDPTTGTQP